MEFKVSTTVTSYKEVMAIVQALAGVVNNINVTDCEGKEDEDNNGDNNEIQQADHQDSRRNEVGRHLPCRVWRLRYLVRVCL